MSSTKTTGGTVETASRNPVVFLEKTTSPVHYSQGQKSSKFLWWTASWGVHRGLGVELHIMLNVEILKVCHAGFSKWRPKNPVKKQLLQFTTPEAKNRQSFAGGRPPGVFIEA